MAEASFEKLGHRHFPNVLTSETIRTAIDLFDAEKVGAGLRLSSAGPLHDVLARDGEAGTIARNLIGDSARPVRLILFDKSAENNWTVGWHQDRVIAVRKCVDVEGYGQWSIKDGTPHVRPPFDLLSCMVTLRLHVDAVDETNAPLLVLDGSHKHGPLTKLQVQDLVDKLPVTTCTASRGDVWAYRTPILHASRPSDPPRRRRTIQVDYAPCGPGEGLEWAFSP